MRKPGMLVVAIALAGTWTLLTLSPAQARISGTSPSGGTSACTTDCAFSSVDAGTVKGGTVIAATVNADTIVNAVGIDAGTINATTVNSTTANPTTVNATTVNATTENSTTINSTTVNSAAASGANGLAFSTTGARVAWTATTGAYLTNDSNAQLLAGRGLRLNNDAQVAPTCASAYRGIQWMTIDNGTNGDQPSFCLRGPSAGSYQWATTLTCRAGTSSCAAPPGYGIYSPGTLSIDGNIIMSGGYLDINAASGEAMEINAGAKAYYGSNYIQANTSTNELEVRAGLRVNQANIARPTCDSTRRGVLWFVQGATGVADTHEICSKDASDAYAWRNLIGP